MSYAIFGDGSCVESGFSDDSVAEDRIEELAAEEGWDTGDLEVIETCPEHDEQPVDDCEECVCGTCGVQTPYDELDENGDCWECAEDDEDEDEDDDVA